MTGFKSIGYGACALKFETVLPLLISIVILIAVAVLKEYSRLVAAITAFMPVNLSLGLWIVAANAEDEHQALVEFTRGLGFGGVPTLVFLIVVIWGAQAGLRLAPLLLAGFVGWAAGLAVMLLARRIFGL
jgi:hypothetical protein